MKRSKWEEVGMKRSKWEKVGGKRSKWEGRGESGREQGGWEGEGNEDWMSLEGGHVSRASYVRVCAGWRERKQNAAGRQDRAKPA